MNTRFSRVAFIGIIFSFVSVLPMAAQDFIIANGIEDANEQDANELEAIVFDKNGWAFVDGKWVKSSDGALYKGQEHQNLTFSITSVINRMGDMEKGLLKAQLLYGKKAEKKLGDMLGSPEKLAEYGQDVTGEWAAAMLEKTFTEGTGFVDALNGRSFNYGKQLDVAINKHIAKSLKLPKPKFAKDAGTVEGAIERETWITEKIVEKFVSNMTEDERRVLAEYIYEELRNEGYDLGTDFVTAFAAGGMAMAWQKGGFKPYIFMSKLIRKIGMFLFNKPLPFVVYKTMSTVAKRVFNFALPVVGIIFTAKMFYDLPGLINPREYDKFIPAVLIIGLSRFSQDDSLEINRLTN